MAVHGIFAIVTIPLVIFAFRQPALQSLPQWMILSMVYPFSIWHFTSIVVFVVWRIGVILRSPLKLILWTMTKFKRTREWIMTIRSQKEFERYNSRRRAFLRQGITVFAGAVFTGTTYRALKRDSYEISEVTVPIAGLPREFEGFTIGLISDIHSSVFMSKEQMDGYVEAMNALGSDLITITGDFVNSSAEEVYPFAEAFSNLRAPLGVFGVLGNHDYYTRKVDIVAREVEDCGIRLLHNENVILQRNGASIHLLGVDDVGTPARAARLFDQSARGIPAGGTRILMCHRPYFFEQAAARNIGLTLAGHTHGGQVVLGKIGNRYFSPARVASPYIAGLYTKGESHMYVSRGIGTVGVPVRINCPPELTRITLTRKA